MLKWLRLALMQLCLVSLGGSALAQSAPDVIIPQAPEKPGEIKAGYPVRLAGEEAFRLYDPYGAKESVRIAEERLLRIAQDPFYTSDLLTTEAGENGVWIYYRDARVGFVSKEAAAILNLSAERRAREIIDAVEKAVARYHSRQSPEEWTRALLMAALATFLLVCAHYLLRLLYRRVVRWIDARSGAGMTVAGQRLGFRNVTRLAAFERRTVRLLYIFLNAFLVLTYLQATFAIIPLTRGYALSMIGYLLDPLRFVWQGLLENIGDFFFIVVIIALARLLLRGIRLLLTETASGSLALSGIARDHGDPLYKILRLVVIAITIVMVYPYIPGSSSAAFQGVSLFAGALFTLGASSAASNFIGGVLLIFSGSFRVGDRVKIGNVVGDVEESTLSLTRLRTSKNELVTFANGNVLAQSLINYSAIARRDGVILHTSITIGYDVPWRKVHELLIGAALRTQHVLDEPAPFVLQTSLNDFHVSYQINVYTREANRMMTVLSDLHQNIQDAFIEGGVEILSPSYTALRDGNFSTEFRGDPLAGPDQ
jgi:small-conductance mechanosensitive channel